MFDAGDSVGGSMVETCSCSGGFIQDVLCRFIALYWIHTSFTLFFPIFFNEHVNWQVFLYLLPWGFFSTVEGEFPLLDDWFILQSNKKVIFKASTC